MTDSSERQGGTPLDRTRLSKTLAFLLRHKPEAGGLKLAEGGWADLERVVGAASRLSRRKIEESDVRSVVEDSRVKRFEIVDGKIRAIADRRRAPRVHPADILYHAVTDHDLERAREKGCLRPAARRPLFLSEDECAAWQVVHRRRRPGRVLYVDSTRARRHGVRFRKHRRSQLYTADRVPLMDALNLQDKYAEQLSAGGVPIALGEDGEPRMALIRVTRRSGVTWEVAKGKLEIGETPEAAAVREVQEEMGLEMGLEITDYVGLIRYGFLAPGGLPRLKSVYLYLMRCEARGLVSFTPRTAEGIGDVRWFTPREAVRAVTHSSLKPLMLEACEVLNRSGSWDPRPPPSG